MKNGICVFVVKPWQAASPIIRSVLGAVFVMRLVGSDVTATNHELVSTDSDVTNKPARSRPSCCKPRWTLNLRNMTNWRRLSVELSWQNMQRLTSSGENIEKSAKFTVCILSISVSTVILHFRCVNYFPPTLSVRVSVTVRVSLVWLVIAANKSN